MAPRSSRPRFNPNAVELPLPERTIVQVARDSWTHIQPITGQDPIPSPDLPTVAPGSLDIPNWNDIIHITPRAFLTPEQKRARTARIAQSIRNSPIPEWRQQWGRVHTMLDNVEDSLFTLGLVGRLALRWFPRLSPVVGLILSADAMVNFAVALMRLPMPRSVKKLRALTQFRINPLEMLRAAYKEATPLRAWPGWGPLLQVPQATDNWFGTGIQIGPLYGLLEGTAFQVVQSAIPGILQGIANTLKNGAPFGGWDAPIILRTGSGLPTEERVGLLAGAAAAFQAMAEKAAHDLGPLLGTKPPPVPRLQEPTPTIEEAPGPPATTDASALARAAQFGVRISPNPQLAPDHAFEMGPPRRTDPITHDTLAALGWDFTAPARWPLPDTPPTIRWPDYRPFLIDQARGFVRELLTELDGTPLGFACAEMVRTTAENAAFVQSLTSTPLPSTPAPYLRLTLEMLERGFTPTADTPAPALTRFLKDYATRTHLDSLRGIDTHHLLTALTHAGFGFRIDLSTPA